MSADDRTRRAFDDLGDRTEQIDPQTSLQRMHRGAPSGSRRWVWALAGAAAVLALVGTVALFGLFPGTPDDDRDFADTTTTDVTVPDTTTTTSFADTTTTVAPPVDGATWFRVDRDLVEADTADPFLNVRRNPDPSSPIVAKLPSTYAGIRWIGRSETSDDGGTWYEIELIDPVTILTLGDVAPGGNPTGYVNATYLEETPEGLPVTADEMAPCAGEGEFGGSGQTPAHVGSVRAAQLSPTCTRIVVGFASGDASFSWDGIPANTGPTNGLPRWYEAQSPWPLIVALPETTTVWPEATDIDGAYVVRNPDRSLSLVVMLPAEETLVRTVPDRGLLVVDLVAGSRQVPPAGANVVLTADPLLPAGGIEVVGITRPFEANLGVSVLDSAGAPVEAVFSGSTFFGTIRTDAYAVQTSDWMEAWGRFALRVEGLAEGSYTLVLDPDGGSDRPRTLDIPFTVAEAGDQATVPSADANRLALEVVAFAQGSTVPPPLAETVLLRLGNQETVTRTGTELADRAKWVIDAADFEGFAGPFDPLGVIAARPEVTVSEGPIPHCAAPPIDWWPGADLVRPQINLEPVGIDSCIQWYAVALRVNASGEIQEIILDLFGP